MLKIQKIKKQEGSISLFVLLSLLFFLVVVTGVGVSSMNKETRIDSQFTRIKEIYEKDVGNEDIIYQAKMTSLPYTIVFDANGGTGTMPSQNFVYGTAQKLRASTFKKEDYTFWNWNTKADGTGKTYKDEQEVENLTVVSGYEILLNKYIAT